VGHKLVVPGPSDRYTGRVYMEGMTDEEAFMEAAFDLNYDIAEWLECAAHFFHVRFLRDEHEILWTTSKCMDLRRFASLPDDDKELDNEYDDIKEPLKQILLWMRKGGTARPSLRGGLRASYAFS